MSKKEEQKRVFLFEQFVKYNKLNEAEGDDLVDDAVGDDEPNADTQAIVEPEVKDKEFLPRLSSVVEKFFFKELKEHIIYWFQYDENFKPFELDSVEEETRAVVAWAFDSVDDGEEPEYAYKIKYAETYTVGKIEKVEELLLIIHIYDYKDSSNLLKQTEMKITLKNVNALFLKKTIDSLKKRIITVPENEDDIEKFKKREERRLGDNMY